MDDLKTSSPNATYVAHCRRGELAYQVDGSNGKPVFPPRVMAPGSGSVDLSWRVSAGVGTVYATTAVANRGAPAHNVALIDMDEGFRLMSRVEGIDPLSVRIRVACVTSGSVSVRPEASRLVSDPRSRLLQPLEQGVR